jgi:hypothetical protein
MLVRLFNQLWTAGHGVVDDSGECLPFVMSRKIGGQRRQEVVDIFERPKDFTVFELNRFDKAPHGPVSVVSGSPSLHRAHCTAQVEAVD